MSTPSQIKHLRENIARAKSYTRRDEIIRALETTAACLRTYAQLKVVGSVRFELEVNLDENLVSISRVTAIQALLPSGPNNKPFIFKFIRGKEELLATALDRLVQSLQEQARTDEEEALRKLEEHKQNLIFTGQSCIDTGDIPRARAMLRRCAEDYGKEPGLLADIALRCRKGGILQEALEIYEMAMDLFPKEGANYVGAIETLTEMREYGKVEKMYERILRQFGLHPSTLTNLAKFYLAWHKKDKAGEAAYRALTMDPSYAEAQAILDEVDGKKLASN